VTSNRARPNHTHECRDCGADIPCYQTEEACTWEGGNADCAECSTEEELTKSFDLTPEEAYDLVVAALDVVTSVSPNVRRRIRAGSYMSSPTIHQAKLLLLMDTLEKIRPGMVAAFDEEG
jgi:hypothetical protein